MNGFSVTAAVILWFHTTCKYLLLKFSLLVPCALAEVHTPLLTPETPISWALFLAPSGPSGTIVLSFTLTACGHMCETQTGSQESSAPGLQVWE